MTAVDEWHVGDHDLARYASHTIPSVARASVESHLLECDRCRSVLTVEHAPAPASSVAVDELWSRIADRIDVTRRPLRSSTTAVQVSTSSPLLMLATLAVAVAVIAGVAFVAAAAPGLSLPLFVVLAPLAPVIGAVLAFQTGIDPAGQLSSATPLASGRLPFLRAAFASGAALVAVAVASMFVPVGVRDVAIWFLPGVALTSLVVAISTWVDPKRVAVSSAAAWTLVVSAWSWSSRPGAGASRELAQFATRQPSVQMALIAVAACSAAVAFVRRDELPAWRCR
jgi:hypothetical protein